MATARSKSLNVPDRYKETGVHLQGGFGEIRILHDEFLDRQVALKTIQNPSDLAQLTAEVLAISKIRSKNVVEIYDLIIDAKGNVQGIIEEYLPGKDLTDFTNSAYEKKRYLKVLYQIASGIADVHGHGRVHRDIKLNNMKHDAEGLIKIFDFGISSVKSAHTTVGARGTAIYAAPELYSPPLKVDVTLDTYAFGVCCWLLGTKAIPRQLTETPPQKSARSPSLSLVDGTLPKDLVAVLDATIDPDPTKRPDMAVVRDLLRLHLLFGTHRAWLSGDHEINKPGQSVSVGNNTVGKITISYDGTKFSVSAIVGSVFINNQSLKVGEELPGSCVITVGSQNLASARSFLQFNVSHPEIVL